MVTAEVGLEPTVGHGGRGKTEGKEGKELSLPAESRF